MIVSSYPSTFALVACSLPSNLVMAPKVSSLEAAEKAIDSIGLGFDITQDIGFDNCKKGSRLIFVDEKQCRLLEIPGGGVSIPNVPNSIKCVRGESIRVFSDVLPLQQAC